MRNRVVSLIIRPSFWAVSAILTLTLLVPPWRQVGTWSDGKKFATGFHKNQLDREWFSYIPAYRPVWSPRTMTDAPGGHLGEYEMTERYWIVSKTGIVVQIIFGMLLAITLDSRLRHPSRL